MTKAEMVDEIMAATGSKFQSDVRPRALRNPKAYIVKAYNVYQQMPEDAEWACMVMACLNR